MRGNVAMGCMDTPSLSNAFLVARGALHVEARKRMTAHLVTSGHTSLFLLGITVANASNVETQPILKGLMVVENVARKVTRLDASLAKLAMY